MLKDNVVDAFFEVIIFLVVFIHRHPGFRYFQGSDMVQPQELERKKMAADVKI